MLLIRIFILLLCLGIGESVRLDTLALSLDGNNDLFTNFIKDFNSFSSENNLNINVKLNLFSNLNSTINYNDYASMIEVLLKRNSRKYDIYLYDNIYTENYGKYLIDLKKYLPEDHIKMYDSNVLSQTCSYNNKLVGLPISLGYSVLYVNQVLLNKYNRTIPETWDELIETGKFIINEERKLNNTSLIAYNGLFSDSSIGLCSIYEFIYSCRDSVDSPFPKLLSETSIKALELIKRIKEEISSDYEFRSSDEFSMMKIIDGNALFLKYFIFPSSLVNNAYKMVQMPGRKKGISGSITVGFNMGIQEKLSDEKLKAAITAFKFMTSKEIQREYTLKHMLVTGIPSLFEDEEVCKNSECELFRNIQPIGRPINKTKNFDEYSEKFINYIYEFLYGNKTAKEVLKKVDDLTNIYYISINTKNSYIGIVVFIINSVVILFMIISVIFLFLENFEPFYKFLSIDFWIIYIIGLIIILNAILTKYGMISNLKCKLFPILISTGLCLSFAPFLHKLIIILPVNSEILEWIRRHKYIFLFFLIFIEILFSGLLFLIDFDIEDVLINEGQNFQICKMNNIYGKLIFGIQVFFNFLIIVTMLLYIFLEWNLEKTRYDIRLLVSSLYINILLFIILFLLDIIKINDYKMNFLIQEIILILISISNYIFNYGIKLIIGFFKKENLRLKFIKNIGKEFINKETINDSVLKTNVLNDSSFKTFSYISNSNSIITETNYTVYYNDSSNKINETTSIKQNFASRMINIHYTT
ncbi:periplasmic binding protein-like II [Neocallimastix lanati (nom. inval.)]|nr:periplasmic binding protein-like II [Neocallimastix sp. JGI-2020a]